MSEELKIIITAEIDKLKAAVQNGKKEVENFAKNSKEKFKGFSEEIQKAGDISKKALGIAAASIAGAATALLALGNSTKEYRENQAKLNAAFESAGASAGSATQVYNDLYRVLGDDDRAVEAANHLGVLTQNQEDLSTWTNICQGVYATFGDSLPIEGLTEAANETAKTGALTGVLADALNWAGISEDKFQEKLDACNTEAEREALIRTTLNKTYKDAAKNYEKNAEDILKQNEAQAKLNEQMAKLGEAMAPINTMLAQLGTEILTVLTPYIEEFTAEYGPVIEETLKKVADAIGSVMKWIIDNWELISTLAVVITAIAVALGVFSTAMGIVNFVMAASPVTWIVLGIVAALTILATTIVLIIKHWDDIQAAVKKAVEAIKQFVSDMVEKVKQKIEDFKTAVSEKFNAVKTAMTDKIQAAKDAVVNKFNSLKDGIKNTLNNIKTSVSNVFGNIKDAIGEKIQAAKDKVSDVVEGMKALFNFKFKTPEIKKPQFAITPAGWKLKDLLEGSIPKLSIKWNAVGGVFDRPTIVPYGNTLQGLGEAGAEAIVPLENNTEWLDKIANKLSAKQNNTPVILNVDGKVFAQTAINTINENTRQTGSLKLNIM